MTNAYNGRGGEMQVRIRSEQKEFLLHKMKEQMIHVTYTVSIGKQSPWGLGRSAPSLVALS